MWALLSTYSWQELRHHPWRSGAAVVAVMLGVALALAVQLINASALAEFGSAVSAVNGQPDLELRARRGALDERWLDRVAAHPQVRVASPVLEWQAQAANAQGQQLGVRLVGVDALSVGALAPALMPRNADTADRLDLFAPDAVWLNPAAAQALGAGPLRLQSGLSWQAARVAGHVAAPGGPLVVMDIAALQDLSERLGELSRIDVRLAPGAQAERVLADLALPETVLAQRPEAAGERVSQLSRAYRVNLTVLALVALFTGCLLYTSPSPRDVEESRMPSSA